MRSCLYYRFVRDPPNSHQFLNTRRHRAMILQYGGRHCCQFWGDNIKRTSVPYVQPYAIPLSTGRSRRLSTLVSTSLRDRSRSKHRDTMINLILPRILDGSRKIVSELPLIYETEYSIGSARSQCHIEKPITLHNFYHKFCRLITSNSRVL